MRMFLFAGLMLCGSAAGAQTSAPVVDAVFLQALEARVTFANASFFLHKELASESADSACGKKKDGVGVSFRPEDVEYLVLLRCVTDDVRVVIEDFIYLDADRDGELDEVVYAKEGEYRVIYQRDHKLGALGEKAGETYQAIFASVLVKLWNHIPAIRGNEI